MASFTTQNSCVRASPFSVGRRSRTIKHPRTSCRETIKKNIKSNHRSHSSSGTPQGPRILSPREQVLAAYAGVYVPKPNHIQSVALEKLFALRSTLHPSPRLITVAASLIQAHWESTSERRDDNLTNHMQTVRSTHLMGYISTTLARSSMVQLSLVVSMHASFPTVALVLALIFVERLKKLHPNARGEAGCGHRLFLVSYMVACKYLQGHLLTYEGRGVRSAHGATAESDENETVASDSPNSQVPASVLSSIILPNEQWARLSGVFSTPELTRMELELLAFLQFDLYVSYDDFMYHWTKYMDINQLVPNEQFHATPPNGFAEDLEGDEGVVPDF